MRGILSLSDCTFVVEPEAKLKDTFVCTAKCPNCLHLVSGQSCDNFLCPQLQCMGIEHCWVGHLAPLSMGSVNSSEGRDQQWWVTSSTRVIPFWWSSDDAIPSKCWAIITQVLLYWFEEHFSSGGGWTIASCCTWCARTVSVHPPPHKAHGWVRVLRSKWTVEETFAWRSSNCPLLLAVNTMVWWREDDLLKWRYLFFPMLTGSMCERAPKHCLEKLVVVVEMTSPLVTLHTELMWARDSRSTTTIP